MTNEELEKAGFSKVEQNFDTDEMWDRQEAIQGLYIQKKEHVSENDSNIYVLDTIEGKRIGVWGSKLLDDMMKDIALETEVYIKCLGQQTPKNGGRPYYIYEVWFKDMIPTGKTVTPEEAEKIITA